jgi:heme exporter protein C
MREELLTITGIAGAVLLAWSTATGAHLVFFYAPLTVGAWFLAGAAMVSSLRFLRTKHFQYDSLSVANIEVGLALLGGSLGAGTIWERTISGRWWDWSVPLTSTLACGLLYVGYLILRHAVQEPTQRATFSAIFSIFAFLDIPMVIMAVAWWSQKHPKPLMWAGMTFAGQWPLLVGTTAGILLLALTLITARVRQEESQRELDSLRRTVHAF